MAPPPRVPQRGDIVWLEFDPQAGHDQNGLRSAVVLSWAIYNERAGLIVCCPTTTRIKGYPFEVALGGDPPSVALTDQVRGLDWRALRARRKGRVADATLPEITSKVAVLIG